MPPERLIAFNETRQLALAEDVTLAGTSETRRKGLLGRGEMPPGFAVWIIPCEAVHTFTMKFPIDLVFLDRDRSVIKLVPVLKPWRIAFYLRAHSALELQAGIIARTGTSIGDRLRFQQA